MPAIAAVSSITTMEEFRSASLEQQREFLAPLAQKMSDKEIAELLGSTDRRDIRYIAYVRIRSNLGKGRGWHLRKENRHRYVSKIKRSKEANGAVELDGSSLNGSFEGLSSQVREGFELKISGLLTASKLSERLQAIHSLLEWISPESVFEVSLTVRKMPAGAEKAEPGKDESILVP